MSIENHQPLLSVIIVAWRSCDEICACVRSLPREMSGRGIEVVVVDNFLGADGVEELLAREAPHVRVIVPEENLGFGRANNLGFRETSGEFVLFLNPDTVCNAAALEHCVNRLRADESIGLISPKLVMLDGSIDAACRRSIPTLWDGFCRASGLAACFPSRALFSGYNLSHLPEDGTYEVGAINGAFMMGRRKFLESISDPPPHAVFDEKFFMYGDDLDLCIRVSRSGKKVIYDGRERITHIKGTSVAKDYGRMSAAIFDANRDVYLKHFNPSRSHFVEWKYTCAFGLWKMVSRFRGLFRKTKRVRPS